MSGGRQRFAVIGGGISGLAAAHRLLTLAPTADVVVLEKKDAPGGLLRTVEIDDFVVELGPDSILREKTAAFDLARSLGLEGRIVTTRRDRHGAYVVTRGALERVPRGFSLVGPGDREALEASAILSEEGRRRAAIEPTVPARDPSVDDERLASFVRRRFGWELLERLAQPLASGIYGADPEILGLRATLPRFLDMETRRGNVTDALVEQQARAHLGDGARYGLFFGFDRGMQVLIDALAAHLGPRLRVGTAVTQLVRDAARDLFVVTTSEGVLEVDGVIVALPGPLSRALLVDVAPTAARGLAEIPHGSAATVTFAFRRDEVPHALDAYGFVVPAVERRRSLASTWASEKWPGRAPDDHVLLRVFMSGDDAHLRDEADLAHDARVELRELLGIRATPRFTRVLAYPEAMPNYGEGHDALRRAIDAAIAAVPGLALAGNSLFGVGIPDAIASGTRGAERVLSITETAR